MFRKRFIALVMALTVLFTLMAPAFTFALDDGEPPDQTPASDAAGDTNEQPPATVPGDGDGEGDADKGGDQGNGDANVGAGDQGNGDANVGDGEGEPLRETPTTRSTLTEGWYLIGINGWTVGDLNGADRFVPDENTGLCTLIRNLDEGAAFKAVYVKLDGEGNPYLEDSSGYAGEDGPFDTDGNVKPGPAGRYYIYFHNEPGKFLRATPLQDEHYYYIGSDIDWEEPRAVELGSDLSITLTFYDATEFKIIECYDHGLLDWYGDSSGQNVSVQAGTYIIRLEDSVVTATPVYTLTTAVSPSGSGTLEASKTAAVDDEQITLTVTPTEGYRFDKLVVNNVEYTVTLDANHQTVIPMPSADATVTAYFAAIEYVIETDANIAHGSVLTSVEKATIGQKVTLMVNPDTGYQVSEVKVNGVAIEPVNGEYSFPMPAANVTVAATFTVDPATAVAKIGDEYFTTLQAALTAAANDPDKTGNIKVTLLTDTAETVTVIQRKDQNLVITGDSEAKPTIAGTIKIDGINGGSGHNGTDTLTISNLKIAYNGATTSNGALIYFMNKSDCGGKLGSQHNVTIENCELDGGQDGIANAIYAVRIGANTQAKNVTLSGLTVRNTYCLVNETGVDNFTVQGCNATAVKNGININGGEGNAVIENNVIEAVGYAYRSGSTASGSTVLRGNTFTGNGTDDDEGAVVVRNVSGTNISPVTIESGFYAGKIKAIDTNKLLTITGGIFSKQPALVYCADGLYPMANPDENTNAAYPYTVGHPVALLNDGLGYATFAAAAAERTSDDDVITLLANITEGPYALAEGKTLKVRKGDYTLDDPTVPEGCKLVVTGPTDGVTTYTAEPDPYPMPQAYIVEITGNAMDTNIPEYGFDLNPTGWIVETLGAEYRFELSSETAAAIQNEDYYNHYKDWRCDYRISFTGGNLAAESFGLFGSYKLDGTDLDIAFRFPDNVAETTVIPALVQWLGQKIGSTGNQFTISFADVCNTVVSFDCGVFNLSDANRGRKMIVELIMWAPDQTPDQAVVIDTKVYDFGPLSTERPPLPEARVDNLEPVFNVPVYDPNTFQETGKVVEKVEDVYKFTPYEVTPDQASTYANWRCDYRISFNDTLVAESFGLFGAYGDYGRIAFLYPNNVNENTVVYLLKDFNLDSKLTFTEVLNNVQEFKCGAFNLSDDNLNKGKIMTVELVMWAPDQTPADAVVIATEYYRFGDKTHIPPTATVEDGEPVENAALYGFDNSGKLNYSEQIGTVEEVKDVFIFTADEVTAATMAFYGDWNCDYRITFHDELAAGSFGLYGAYGEFGVAFVSPIDVAANQEVNLIATLLDDTLSYRTVKTGISPFTCGVYNLEAENKGKTMTVELVIWQGEDKANAIVIKSVDYTFGDPTEYTFEKPPLPDAKIEKVNEHTNIPVWAYDGSNYYDTGETVDTLGAEYLFVLDPETTQEQKDYYANWCCDFRVTFDGALAADSFGLFGAYDEYNIAFNFPENVDETKEYYLVRWLGQMIGFSDEFAVDFQTVCNYRFYCGVYNRSGANLGKTMKVELIMWDPGDPTHVEVRDTKTYYFGDVPMPGAEVEDVTGEHTSITEIAFTSDGFEQTGTVEELDAEYLFTLKLDDDDAVAALQTETYKDWRCDFLVSFDDNMTANSFGLFGAYGPNEVAFQFPENIAANNEFKLCEWIAQKTGLEHDFTIKFSDIINYVQGQFYCGVYNLDFRNAGKKMTVTLVMWNESDPNTLYPIETVVYTFEGVVPELPEAEIVDITGTEKAHKNIVEYELVENVVQETGKTIAKLDAEYEFVLDPETTQAQKDEYAYWCCDFLVSFDADMEANSFGLFGAYAQYGAYAFKFPENVRANEEFKLVSLLGQKILGGNGFDIRFSDIMDIDFFCGVYNLSAKNCGKTMTVKLVMWDPKNPNDIKVRDTVTYTFPTPELPTATVTELEEPATGVALYDPNDIMNGATGYTADLEAEFSFKANDVTSEQMAYYGDWLCDYEIEFIDAFEAGSFGLYGEIAAFDLARGFVWPTAVQAGDKLMLLGDTLGYTRTYQVVKEEIGTFLCGVINLDATNAGKKIAVRLKMWDPEAAEGTEPAKIAEVVYTFKAIYTIGLSSQDTQGNTIGNAVGGGDYASGKDVSVSVENVSEGYAFLGWYKDSYAEGNLVSTEMPYTFTASESINLIAVWESNAALLYDLRVIGKGFTVGDSPTVQNWNADYLNYGPAGTRVNIEYIGPTEEYPDQFVYWVNEAGNILSTGKAFTYVLMSDSTVRLVTAGTATEDLSVYVVFKNAFNQVLSEGRVGDEFEYEDKIPDQPSRMGYTFQYWAFDGTTTEATYAEVESRMSSTENVVLTIVPFYEQNDGEYTVTVEVLNKATNEKTTAKEYSAAVGEKCVVKLADVYTGDATDFRFWSRDGGETAASFDNSQFTVLSAKDNFTLTLVVNGAEVEPYASIAITQMFTTNLNNIKKIGTTLQYYVPEGATVVAAGFLYGKKEGVTYDEALMNLDGVDLNGDTVIMHAASNANGTNALIYTLNYRLKTNDTENTVLHIRAFVSYEMTAGGETVRETIYSDVFSNSYAELN